MHQSSGRWKLGLMLSLITATFWGMLPIALKGLLVSIDAMTITWYRFIVSLIVVALLLYQRNQLPDFKWLKAPKTRWLFGMVILGLSCNYALYLLGLDLVTPSAAQIVIQIAPMLLLLGGLFIFRETFGPLQWSGLLMFVAGLGLFFNHRVEDILNSVTSLDGEVGYGWGLILVLLAAITWAVYALAQKQLLISFGSQQIMFIAYIAASVLFLPGAEILSVSTLTMTQWGLLVFCCLNTLVAYGCFAEALNHWEASRVGAVLTITPLITIAFAFLTNQIFPQYITIEPLNGISLAGAGILVVGSLTAALAKTKSNELQRSR
jgi:drug/metabolite transporter (DMT)-like permease